ncbi:MAG TPA: hypothetical protein VFE31_03345 [Opitutaceae bacterium]|nr:hypothetical protein [Opitutaceae bacterium]
MADRSFRPFLSDAAADFVLALPRGRARAVLDRLRQLAANRSVEPDYIECEDTGRKISQICEVDFAISDWAESAVKRVMSTELHWLD